MQNYVTFGQDHIHKIGKNIFDANCVACYETKNEKEGRKKAFELFGLKFCFHYAERDFDKTCLLDYFPRGIINV